MVFKKKELKSSSSLTVSVRRETKQVYNPEGRILSEERLHAYSYAACWNDKSIFSVTGVSLRAIYSS